MRFFGFLPDEGGNVAVIASLCMGSLFLAGGAAVDFGRLKSSRDYLQQSIDAAALASVVADSSESEATFAKYLDKSMPGAAVTAFERTKIANGVKVKATATIGVPASLMSLFGYGDMVAKVSTEAFAPGQIERVSLNLKSAFGWSNKNLRVIVDRPDGTKETLLTASYKMTDKKGGDMRGTGTFTYSPSMTVDIGDYTALRVEMEVIEYGSGKKVKYSSDNPSQADHLWVGGKQLPKGVTSGLETVLPCGTKISHAWEDSALKSEWDVQDLFFDVDVTCGVGKSAESIRITR